MKKLIPDNAVLIPDNATCKFKGVIYDIYQWQQEMFDGSMDTFEMLKRPDTVIAICIVDGKILVLDEEQPHRGFAKSFPGGRVDEEDSDILTAAQREVREETGYDFKNWQLLHVWQPMTKIEWFEHVFVASGVTNQQPPHLDAGEKIEVLNLSFEEVKSLVRSNAGYLGESLSIFEETNSIDAILALPEFTGQSVDR